jgi:transcription antitermination factor NusG
VAAACLAPIRTDIDRDGGDWFAVQVWAGRERLAATHLRNRCYEIFAPSYVEHRRWSDRVKKIERALFDGYVFCRVGAAETYAKIITSPGVIRLVGDGTRPLPVPAHEIESIRRVVETRLPIEPWPFLTAGQRVRIETGPLQNAEGTVLRMKSRHRLVVSISLLQRSVAVELDPEWVSITPKQFEAPSHNPMSA